MNRKFRLRTTSWIEPMVLMFFAIAVFMLTVWVINANNPGIEADCIARGGAVIERYGRFSYCISTEVLR